MKMARRETQSPGQRPPVAAHLLPGPVSGKTPLAVTSAARHHHRWRRRRPHLRDASVAQERSAQIPQCRARERRRGAPRTPFRTHRGQGAPNWDADTYSVIEARARLSTTQNFNLLNWFSDRGIKAYNSSKLGYFAEVKIANLHRRHHHFKGLFAGGTDRRAQHLHVA